MADLRIGLTATVVQGNLCFVKVPSERGRYMLTDLCVVAVECPICEAIVGEPCRSHYGLKYWDRIYPREKPLAHCVTVHYRRRNLAVERFGRHYPTRIAEHFRLRLAAGDVSAAMDSMPDIDFPVTRKDHAAE